MILISIIPYIFLKACEKTSQLKLKTDEFRNPYFNRLILIALFLDCQQAQFKSRKLIHHATLIPSINYLVNPVFLLTTAIL